ncbi:xylose isomerase TIM barrel [Colletotrichum higginsianum]|nr:xylose isomerase TIM barrel [Colletotrichum higginsianum]
MPTIARFRTLWGIPAGDQFANWIAIFPDLKAKGYNHLDFYRKSLERAQILKPVKVNAQSGSDVWTLDQSVEFYRGTFKIDEELGFAGRVTHETHRNRSLFTPYATKYILEKVPK